MTGEKNDNQGTRIPYEPPRLFDLGGGVAYAQATCKPGGSPAAGGCKSGSAATSGPCNSGGIAGHGPCKAGGVPAYACKAGSTK